MKTAKQNNAEFTGSIESPSQTIVLPPLPRKYFANSEKSIRLQFEAWAKQGVRPEMYPLRQVANGEYVSVYTENAWKAFRAGWEANV